jgi:hypothetical protein
VNKRIISLVKRVAFVSDRMSYIMLRGRWCHVIVLNVHCTVDKKGDKTDCNNYRGTSLLSTSYKILWNVLLLRLSPYIDEIIGDHQCEFRRSRRTTGEIFCICQILKKKWKYYNETVHQLFIDFKNAYDSVRKEVLYNILIEFGVPMKLDRCV